MIVIGTAGWQVPRVSADRFPGAGTHLQRYARVFHGVEIDTSAYRDHSRETYQRWAAQTPRNFSFAVKLPSAVTHESRLRAARRPLQQFLARVEGLGRKLGPLIVQLPPSLQFEARVAATFFNLVRELHAGPVVCEPRHASWFEARAESLLKRQRIGRVAADPAALPLAFEPGGWPGLVYYRLHGSPRKYWSVYETQRLQQWANALAALPRGTPGWCVLDNTAGGGATGNALQMLGMTGRRGEN